MYSKDIPSAPKARPKVSIEHDMAFVLTIEASRQGARGQGLQKAQARPPPLKRPRDMWLTQAIGETINLLISKELQITYEYTCVYIHIYIYIYIQIYVSSARAQTGGSIRTESNKPIKQSIDRSVNQSINQSIPGEQSREQSRGSNVKRAIQSASLWPPFGIPSVSFWDSLTTDNKKKDLVTQVWHKPGEQSRRAIQRAIG